MITEFEFSGITMSHLAAYRHAVVQLDASKADGCSSSVVHHWRSQVELFAGLLAISFEIDATENGV